MNLKIKKKKKKKKKTVSNYVTFDLCPILVTWQYGTMYQNTVFPLHLFYHTVKLKKKKRKTENSILAHYTILCVSQQ
jgi:hypothetical protein